MKYISDRSTAVLERYRSMLWAQDKEIPADLYFELLARDLDR